MLFSRWIKNWKSALAENTFLRFTILLLGAGLVLNATVLREETKVVIVPPTLTSEFWINRTQASESYLNQMGVFIATLAGNLSPRSAVFNTESLLKYMEPYRSVNVRDDLAKQAQYIQKNNITQVFNPQKTRVDVQAQTVTVEGDVVRYIGTIRTHNEKMEINMKFRLSDYMLKVLDLYVVYPERGKGKKNVAELDKFAVPPIGGGISSADYTEEEGME